MNIFYKISQIDNIKGIKSPHENDLNDISSKRIKFFDNLSKSQIDDIIELIDGFKGNIDLGQDWIISKEIFKNAFIHILYYNNEQEEDNLFDKNSEIQFVFSGDNITLISGEDLTYYCEILLEYILNSYNEKLKMKSNYNIPKNDSQNYNFNISNMLKIAIQERSEPFFKFKNIDFEEMANFIKGKLLKSISSKNSLFALNFIPFQTISIIVVGNSQQETLNIQLEGAGIKYLPHYAIERLIINTINHCLRFIFINNMNDNLSELQKYPIFKKMFSGLYIKNNPEKFT